MFFNLLIIAFILVMAYWWGRQGAFSALLHLLAVIVSGAIALAIWEPLVMGVLLARMHNYAWGVGLLGPFVLLLIILRTIIDRAVRANVHFSLPVNRVVGGVFGILAAVLVAGLFTVGISFMFMPSSIIGYEPYVIDSNGQVVDNPGGGSLMIPVDRQAMAFFTMLSGGSFYSGAPMATYAADLAKQAALFRMRYDENSSVSAGAESVSVGQVGVFPTPLKGVDDLVVRDIGDPARELNNKLVVIDTAWVLNAKDGTYDDDGLLRVFPTQIRLLTVLPGIGEVAPDTDPQLEAPVGVSKLDPNTHARTYIPLHDVQSFAYSERSASFAWVFVVRSDRTPRFLFVRHLRLTMPAEFATTPAVAGPLVGSPVNTTVATHSPLDTTPTNTSTGTGAATSVNPQYGQNPGSAATALEVSDLLPFPISINRASSLVFDEKTVKVKSGVALVEPTNGFIPKDVRCDGVYTFPTQTIVRMPIDKQSAQSLFGAARVAAAALGGIWLEDSGGEKYLPFGYAWLHGAGSSQDISIDRDKPIRSSRDTPIHDMQANDKFYLYFAVPHNAKIVQITIGTGKQDANLTVP